MVVPPLPGELTGGFRSSMGPPTKNRATARDEALSKALLPSIPRRDGWPGRNPPKICPQRPQPLFRAISQLLVDSYKAAQGGTCTEPSKLSEESMPDKPRSSISYIYSASDAANAPSIRVLRCILCVLICGAFCVHALLMHCTLFT